MATTHTLAAQKRDATGKSPAARRLRKEGRVPGTLYRRGEQAVSFSVDALETAALIRHSAHMVDLDIEGDRHRSVIKEYQLHPLRGTIQHLDLQEIKGDQLVRLSVGVDIVGEAPGVKSGGVLTVAVHEFSIEARASNIPEAITVDVSELELGDQLHLSGITAPDGVTFLDSPDMLLAGVSVPRGLKGDAEAEEEAGEGAEEGAEAGAAESASTEGTSEEG